MESKMAQIRGFELPDELYYLVEKHVWAAAPVNGVSRIGMTPVAYQLLRHSLVAISIKESVIGKEVAKGKSVAMIESLKFIGPLPAPFTGTLLRANPLVLNDPSIAEKDPYGEGWIVEMAAADWGSAAAGLASGEDGLAAYRKLLESQNIDTNT
jgi:glycine cleavage system H protein